ncbi:SRA stem-loop-interacting RNA-binding protein, mitochondrial-like [Aphidius gifuensis]|uniref:SRA stem-loop-interacting RNA-binding protein, mitochondrial-like n=1 Tax=Aphidius gifuensis TaxID=684658 RepID=UPI001CDCAB69|nr:SRA stem-loop-interacting RNA-binding protein, mitochondrial-like [Aphidius gifuensis]
MAGVGVGKTLHKLRVVNIPWTIGDLQLKQYFSQFGFINNAKVIFDRRTGLSKNFGYLEITDKDTYHNIVEKKNHHLEGYELYVRRFFEN